MQTTTDPSSSKPAAGRFSWKPFAVGLCLGLAVAAGVAAAPRPGGATAIGRFRLVRAYRETMLVDTMTGQVWARIDRDFHEPKVMVSAIR